MDAGFDVTALDISPEVEVLGPYASRVRFIQADIRDRSVLRAVMPSVMGVIHLAAMSRVSWCALWARQCMAINVQGTQTVIDAILEQRPRPWLLHASSREVFGGVREMPVNESTPQLALNVYGQSKVESEKRVRQAVAEGGFVATIFRFSNVYGSPKDHADRVIPGFIAAALNDQPLAVSGTKLVDFTHVDDTSRAVLLAVHQLEEWASQRAWGSGLCEDFNIASGQSSDLRMVAELIIRLAQSSSPIIAMRSDPMFVDAYSTRLEKAAAALRFTAKVRIEDGLQRYIALMKTGKTFLGQNAAGFQAGLGQSRMLRLYDVPLDVHQLTPKPLKIVIVGAGVCGICAAIRLLELGHRNFELLEASDRPGGLASSFQDDKGFTWDIGVHVLFSHYQFFDVLLDNNVPPQEWGHHVRGVKAYMKGKYIDYPVQNNLFMLPEKDVVRCLEGLLDAVLARNDSAPAPGDFREWVLRNFGEGLADTFLLPYNFKVWAHPAPEMNHQWVGERVAKVNVKEVVANTVRRRSQPNWGPNAIFRYPLNGTGQIWENVRRAIPSAKLRLNSVVEHIGPSKEITLVGGAKVPYDCLLSTLPMDRLLTLLSPKLRPEGVTSTTFVHQTVHIVGLGFHGTLPAHLHGVHWLYFPEPDIPFYRVTVLSTFSPRLVPGPGFYSILAEVSESKYRTVDQDNIVDATLQACQAINLTSPTTRVASVWHKRIEHGYPVPYLHRDRDVHTADEQLRSAGIWSRGRFGGWKYEVSNQDHVCMQGVEAVDNMLLGLKELTFFQPDVVNSMYRPYPPHPLVSALYPQLPVLEIIISPCGEAMDWLSHTLKHSLPPGMKFVVHLYERCPSARSTIWDAIHHVQRVPFPSGPPIAAILHHLSHSTVTDASTALVFLSAQPANPTSLADQLAEAVRKKRDGFYFLAGTQVTVENTAAQCEVYSRLMEGKCPKFYRTRTGSQFLVTRRRVGLVAPSVWRDALQLVQDRPEEAPALLDGLWPLLFGEAPTTDILPPGSRQRPPVAP
eukprot:GGOE01055351.1.p1 GENE.GGOE01055351.1~~GGOE01055351.1.p1  ORF type:complete len:1118 (+),score=394.62 GGOE01055351.1:302-3355(+)